MDEDQRCRAGEDRISGLPDELLHNILAGLGSVRAAARTCVLSHRWRHVWTQLPTLGLFHREEEPLTSSSFMDSVDAVLAAYSAPAMECLRIMPHKDFHRVRVPARRVAPWLRFASERMVGDLAVSVPGFGEEEDVEEELEIPPCHGATRINLTLDRRWRIRLPPAGSFTALTELILQSARVEGSELTALVCMQCPRLRILVLIVTLCASSGVSIRTNSLMALVFNVNNTRQLEVVAPRLETLVVHHVDSHMTISAPKLAELYYWNDVYDPRRHQYVDVGRHLRLLHLNHASLSLLQRFDDVDELILHISVSEEIFGYESLLNETSRLPKCESLSVYLVWNQHCFVPIMLHLLRGCSTTRKFSVSLCSASYTWTDSCPSSCPCRLTKTRRFDDISLGSLEELEIKDFGSSKEEVEFLEQLSNSNASNLRKVGIYEGQCFGCVPLTKEVCEMVRRKCHANLRVEFYVRSGIQWVFFD